MMRSCISCIRNRNMATHISRYLLRFADSSVFARRIVEYIQEYAICNISQYKNRTRDKTGRCTSDTTSANAQKKSAATTKSKIMLYLQCAPYPPRKQSPKKAVWRRTAGTEKNRARTYILQYRKVYIVVVLYILIVL